MKIRVIAAFAAIVLGVVSSAEAAWVYTETNTVVNGTSKGYLTDGVWTLPTERTKNSVELSVNAQKGSLAESYANGTELLSMDFSTGITGSSESTHQSGSGYKLVSFRQFSFEKNDGSHSLRPYKDRLADFVAPDCRTIGFQCGFYQCTMLTNVQLQAGAEISQKNQFSGCSSLSDIYPRTFKTLGNATFNGCSSLKGRIELTDQSSINQYMFSGCALLEEVIAPNVTYIDVSGFNGCSSLTNVVLSDAITGVKQYGFRGCEKLGTKFVQNVLSGCLTVVGKGAFKDCKNVEGSLVWNEPSLSVLSSDMFSGCKNLSGIVFKTPITSIQSSSLFELAPGAELYFDCLAPTEFGEKGIMNTGTPYMKVFLSEDFDAWLDIMESHKNNYVVRKADFATTAVSSHAGKRMLDDKTMCINEDGVLKVFDKKVLGFLYWEKGHGCWVLRAPQRGFNVSVR